MQRINEITQEELRVLDDIDKNCIAMHVMTPPRTFLQFDVFKGGEQILEYKTRSKSWVRNGWNVVANQMLGVGNRGGDPVTGYEAGSLRVRATAGSIQDTSQCASIVDPSYWTGGAGVDGDGIVVGSGDAAESFDGNPTGHQLETRILDGTGAGELSYVEQENSILNYDTGNKKYTSTLARFFNNNSGGSVTVREVGAYVHLHRGTSGTSLGRFMLCRDLLSSPITIPDTAQLKVTYTIEMTFPH